MGKASNSSDPGPLRGSAGPGRQADGMTRTYEQNLQRDAGTTEQELTSLGYAPMPTDPMRGRQMRKDQSTKYECDGCKLWFDEVREAYMFTSLCRACSRRSAGARSR